VRETIVIRGVEAQNGHGDLSLAQTQVGQSHGMPRTRDL
jgi:hypothetical protein